MNEFGLLFHLLAATTSFLLFLLSLAFADKKLEFLIQPTCHGLLLSSLFFSIAVARDAKQFFQGSDDNDSSFDVVARPLAYSDEAYDLHQFITSLAAASLIEGALVRGFSAGAFSSGYFEPLLKLFVLISLLADLKISTHVARSGFDRKFKINFGYICVVALLVFLCQTFNQEVTLPFVNMPLALLQLIIDFKFSYSVLGEKKLEKRA